MDDHSNKYIDKDPYIKVLFNAIFNRLVSSKLVTDYLG